MELGIAVATNGTRRTFLLSPDDVAIKLPSNIQGWNYFRYPHVGVEGDPASALAVPAGRIREEILGLTSEMSWPLFYRQIVSLHDEIIRDHPPGLDPHVVVAVNMGGMIVGGLFQYKSRTRFHLMTLWTKNESHCRTLVQRQDDVRRELKEVSDEVRRQGDNSKLRILLLDDSDKSGEAMSQAVALVKEVVPDAVVRTAAIVYAGPESSKPNHCKHVNEYQLFKYGPI
jgi:hypoxanthine phosphoribosyltransferase